MSEEKNKYFDSHVHTDPERFRRFPFTLFHVKIFKPGYSFDSLLYYARKRKLSAVAITEHDIPTIITDEMKQEAQKKNLIIIPGIEITCTFRNRHPHLVGLGIEKWDKIEDFYEKFSLEQAADWIHARGGLVVAAHPTLWPSDWAMTYQEVLRLAHMLDAVEVGTTLGINQKLVEIIETHNSLNLKHKLAFVGGSDAHYPSAIGKHVLTVYKTEDPLEAIRKQETIVIEKAPLNAVIKYLWSAATHLLYPRINEK